MCFFFNDTATTEIYTLSLHDALPISSAQAIRRHSPGSTAGTRSVPVHAETPPDGSLGVRREPRIRSPVPATASRESRKRSEEHTSELQSRQYLVCRLLLEKKNILQSK